MEKHGNRKEAVHALINTWLRLPTKSCASCGAEYDGLTCCEFPVICTNYTAMKQFLKELREFKASRLNVHASNKDKTMRLGVSLPANLYYFLDCAMQRLYQEKLFTEKYTNQWFAKNFPQFQVPERL